MSAEHGGDGEAAKAGEIHTGLEPQAYRFDLHDPRWAQHLRDEGYCVVSGVASDAEVEQSKALLWRDLEAAHGAARGAPETWGGFWLP